MILIRLILVLLYLAGLPIVTQAQVKSIRPYKKMRAIVVGVSDYRNEKIADLPFADDDARYFARMLEDQTEWKVAPQDITLLIDSAATYGRFIAELNAIVKISQPKDRVVIFFAGHGDVETISERKTGYLLFHDSSNKTYAAGGACEVNTLDQKIQELTLDKQAQVVLIADACRSGSLAGSQIDGAQATAAALNTLFNNTVKLLSCEATELSLEDPKLGGGHGLFSYYLVQGMLGAANTNDDAFVSLFELERYLENEVRAASNERQTPDVSGPSSLRMAKASRNNPAINTPLNSLASTERSAVTTADQKVTERFLAFSSAVTAGHLLFPKRGSALSIYDNIGEGPEALVFRDIMRKTLISELQKDAQRAISDYTSAPGKQLARRWVDSKAYSYYPAYLEKAAELLGTEDCFYKDIMSRAHYFRGVNIRLKAELEDGDSLSFEKALEEQQRALEILCNGTAPHVFNEIGLIHRHFERTEKEIAYFSKAVEQSPRWGLALSNLAICYKNKNDFSQAEEYYLKAIEADPDLSLPYYNLGSLYDDYGKKHQAIIAYKKAVSKPDPFPEIYYNLVQVMDTSDALIAEAIPYGETYVRLEPYDVYGYLQLGNHYRLLGKYQKARDMFDFALALEPEDFYVHLMYGFLQTETEEYSGAIDSWQRVLKEAPEHPFALKLIAASYAATDQPDQAIDHLEKLLQAHDRNYEDLDAEKYFQKLANLPRYQALLQQYFPERF